jgi:hypothetical protein
VKRRFDLRVALKPVNWGPGRTLDRGAKISLHNSFPSSLSDLKAVRFKVKKSYQFCATIPYGGKPQAE